LSAKLRENGWTDLHEIFREDMEWPWDDLITCLVNSEKPRDVAMRNTRAWTLEPVPKKSTRRLRSTDSSCYSTPRLRTKFGERAFSFSGPSAWNALPSDVRDEACTTTFKKKLKTFYFHSRLTASNMYSVLRVLLTIALLVVGALHVNKCPDWLNDWLIAGFVVL